MKRFISIISSFVLCCSFLISTTFAAPHTTSAFSTSTVYGYTYNYYSIIGIQDSSDNLYGGVTVQSSNSSIAIPVGYMGTCPRLYTSSGVLSKSGSWRYNSIEISYANGTIFPSESGTYYSKGQVRMYNGNGYTTYTANATPNYTQKSAPIASGYSLKTNQNGLTYGSAYFSEVEPDLILAEGISGNLGYVKSSDLNGPEPTAVGDAIQIQDLTPQTRVIPVYDLDGVSIIDTFIVEETIMVYSPD